MKQQQFEAANAPLWHEYRLLLEYLDGGAKARRNPAQVNLQGFPALYSTICGHYALARTRAYSPGLIADLHDLARRGYRHLYRRRPRVLSAALGFMAADFPRVLRRHALAFWMGMALLFLPMLAMGVAAYLDEEIIYSLMDGLQVGNLEELYDPANRKPGRSRERQADTDFAMFGFYIMNNVGIGFRSFASGLIFGVGSAVILVFNGLNIGAAAGHLTRLDYGGTFWTFVSGHGPYELTAIAISGAAGLLLGKALLAPGRRSRLAALRENARDAIVLVGGAAIMLLLAAVVEAFWSSGSAPAAVKYGVGLAGWVLVALYLALAGRGRHDGA
ncbi:stage II sporulation protein M [Thiorhodococcus mannitoliphagus]|uniref:Stage II sporulation protein M n=1 Tax=Thiorhodococcus mannitoliphagus TaxID=329406 RepID=A0A6P1DNS2_9GAMM|nr:stage II sporulation protein M [Thiorhodococcus mannitoliphagus]NEX19190.1 stage II sporulation protein M [Thiorhodococcus mannitoliphagus]